jgi:hypothetical protein
MAAMVRISLFGDIGLFDFGVLGMDQPLRVVLSWVCAKARGCANALLQWALERFGMRSWI